MTEKEALIELDKLAVEAIALVRSNAPHVRSRRQSVLLEAMSVAWQSIRAMNVEQEAEIKRLRDVVKLSIKLGETE